MDISIGVCAYNEEANIAGLLESLLAQKTRQAGIAEIIVVSDGSTDRTEGLIKGIPGDARVKLIAFPERRGKWVAVNKFLETARSPVLVLAAADISIPEAAVETLCAPLLSDERIGITAARSIPKNPKDPFLGYMAHLQAHLRHELSLERPKFSELIAFRNVVPSIPATFVDEEEIASLIRAQGYLLRYVPEAVFYNRGPETLREFVSQRKRNHIGHVMLQRRHRYEAVTLRGARVWQCLRQDASREYRKAGLKLPAAIFLEILIRALARLDLFLRRGRYDYRWKVAKTTKAIE